MKRASYRKAIDWIAVNDSAADDTADDPSIVAELVSAVLVAELFDVDPLKVGADVVRARSKSISMSKQYAIYLKRDPQSVLLTDGAYTNQANCFKPPMHFRPQLYSSRKEARCDGHSYVAREYDGPKDADG
jgi:hypothetical protein